jgi:hypothetical protein
VANLDELYDAATPARQQLATILRDCAPSAQVQVIGSLDELHSAQGVSSGSAIKVTAQPNTCADVGIDIFL